MEGYTLTEEREKNYWEELKMLSKEELEKILKEKEEDYQETEDMKDFLLKHTTNHHVPGYTHNNYVLNLQELEKELEYIKQLINKKQ